MTVEDLKTYINTRTKITQLERSIPRLSEAIERMERDAPCVSDVVAHGRRGKKPIKTSLITGFPDPEYQSKKTRLLAQRLELEAMLARAKEMSDEVEAFVAAIPSAEVTEIVTLKFLGDREMTWQEVADAMTSDPRYGFYTRDSVRQIFKRYICNA